VKVQIGTQLYYWPGPIHSGQPCAAIVTYTHATGAVDVSVFWPSGSVSGKSNLQIIEPGMDAVGEHLTWPHNASDVANAAREGFHNAIRSGQ
jgi:hypothetical protein